MLGTFRKSPDQLAALNQIELWTRSRFKLAAFETILVTELTCALPGCPPLETVVAFWTADKTRHHFKIFKRASEVIESDLPFAWMKPTLAVADGFDPYCC